MSEQQLKKFHLVGQYESLFHAHGVKIEEALRKVGLPEDLFRRKRPRVTESQYFSLMEAMASLSGEPMLAIQLGTSDRIETFSPPIFAAYCSRDGNSCLQRLAEYKCLIGPVHYQISEEDDSVLVTISAASGRALPPFLVKVEMSFLLHILRSATKEMITPLRAMLRDIENDAAFEEYLGVGIVRGDTDNMIFLAEDLKIPFITRNDTMWDFCAPELTRRLHELDVDESISARVCSVLTELLPAGEGNMDGVAGKLGLSRRTLQRKLKEEGTTFQQQLDHTRKLLAKHYLRNTELSVASIAYLLGFEETNSFQRSFSLWTGMSVGQFKKANQQGKEIHEHQ